MPKQLRMLPYDVQKPHKVIVSKDGGRTIIQNGQVYESGSGQHLGTVKNILVPSKNVVMCEHTGATFPNTPEGKRGLQRYQDWKGIGKKVVKSDVVPESSLAERKQQVSNKRDKIKKDD